MVIGFCGRYIKGLSADKDSKNFWYDRKSKKIITNKLECKTFRSINLKFSKMEKQTIWQKLGSFLLKNWKTTLGGLLSLIVLILTGSGVISVEIGGIITTILISLGLIAAKDGDKTGL